MSTDADTMVSSAARALALRARADLVVRRQRYLGRSYWVVKEPIALKYFRFQEEEYAVLRMLDGRRSLDEIRQAFHERFRPQKITLPDLHQFVGQLHRSGLVISDAQGQGRSLHLRSGEVRRRQWLQLISSVLAMRFKGIDPEWILTRGYPLVRWLFHPAVVAFCLTMMAAALLLVTVQFDVFQRRLPSFHQFFGPQNWLLLMLVLAVTKVLHEFGHGFACKHFGGECHEIGVMLLVLTPCLYCNVSDSWLLRNKWHRAAIGAAGMYVELVLASIATFVWWFTEPGVLINQLALQVMFISSVSTLLFNGNPLLRYDGYYILSDVLEIPNLRQKASQILQRFLARWCLGLKLPENPFLPQRNRFLFGSYTVASSVYRWVVLFSIMWFLNKVFEPYGLKVIGQLIMLVGLFGLVVVPLYQLGKFLYVPGRMDEVKRKHVLATAGVVSAVLAFVLLVPLPHRVKCPVEIRARDAASVFIEVPGTIEAHGIQVAPGDQVQAGAPLLRLVNHDLKVSLAELKGRLDQQETLLMGLQMQRTVDTAAGGEIPAARKTLAALKEQLREKEQEIQQLEVAAPVAGTVLPPANHRPQPPADGQLPSWSGSPLDRFNEGVFLDRGVPVCEIGDPLRMEAVLIVDQGDVEFVQPGQRVRVKLDALTDTTLVGEIMEIAEHELNAVSESLSQQHGGTLPTRTDATGVQRPLHTCYVARVPLDNNDGQLLQGLRGRAKIDTPWLTLGQRAYRFALRTFHFEM